MTSPTALGPQSEPTQQIAPPWHYQHPPLVPQNPPPANAPRPTGQPKQPARKARRPRTGAEPQIKPYQPRLALRGISGHLTRTRSGTMAWYALAPRAWSMRPDHERDALMSAIGRTLSALPERWLHWRVTWQPYPAAEWARRHDQWAHPLPDTYNGVSWCGENLHA